MKQEVTQKLYNSCILLLVWLGAINAYAQSFTIDHSSIDIEKIPSYWIEKVKQDQVLIQCVGQSHARQYENGLLLLEQLDSRFSVELAADLNFTEPNCLRVLRSQYSSVYRKWTGDSVDDDKYWSTDEARQMTLASASQAIAQGRPIAASVFCWCWDICKPDSYFSQADEFTEEHLGWYLNAIDQFNHDFTVSPTLFIYQTSVSDCKDYLNPNGPCAESD